MKGRDKIIVLYGFSSTFLRTKHFKNPPHFANRDRDGTKDFKNPLQ